MAKIDMSVLGNNGERESFYTLWLPDSGKRAADLYQEMRDRDAVIGGVFLAIEALFRQTRWQAKPANDSEEAVFWANFLEECMQDMSHTFPSFIGQVASGLLTHGWGYFEKVFKLRLGPDQADASRRSRYSDGRVGWRKFARRPQTSLSRWKYDQDGGIQGMYQNTPSGEVFLPIQKCLHFTSNDEMPEGRSLLVNARQSYKYQERIAQFESIGIERDLAGMPYVQVPPELLEVDPADTSEEAAAKRATLRALQDMAAGVRNDTQAYVMMPAEKVAWQEKAKDGSVSIKEVTTGYKFSLLTSGGTRAHDTDQIIKRYTQRVASSVLSTWLLLGGSEGSGAKSLGTELTDVFLTVNTGLLDSVTAVINRFAVQDLMRLNGVPVDLWPELVNDGLKKDDVTALLDNVSKLAREKLITPDQPLEDYLRALLELPDRAEEQQQPASPSTGQGSEGQQDQQGQGQQDQQQKAEAFSNLLAEVATLFLDMNDQTGGK